LTNRLRVATPIVCLMLTLLPALTTNAQAQSGASAGKNMRVIQELRHDVSLPLRDLKPLREANVRVEHDLGRLQHNFPKLAQGADSALQTAAPAALSVTAGLNFDGIGQGVFGFSVNSAPPDTSGAVGATQYVQWVNTSFAVFDKTSGALLFGPAAGNTLWQGFGGLCASDNDGDIVVLYDKMANRWVMSQFAVSGANGGTTKFLQCVAVSTTSDATGTYNRYAFPYSSFNDYPKMGVWSDAYYESYNMFNAAGTLFLGSDACAFNRTAMLNGNTATQICFQQSSSIGGLLPADMDGTLAPTAGEPGFFMTYSTNSAMQLWKFHVDFATPANSTFTGPTNIPVASFTELCNGGTCVPQSGTTNRLDSLADRLMYRLAWRRFPDGHQALVVTHSISTGIRWYEFRNPNGTPTLFQQGTFAPDASTRWMGSIAMDQAGDIALGYSVSSGTIHPSIFITGRVPSDAAGTMQAETAIVTGTGSQTGGLTRWGDYSQMTVDPVDDCTFWYTQEYLKANGSFNWNTRIATFKFPGCGGAGGTVTLSPSSLNFGSQTVNTTSSPLPVTLTNNQSVALHVSSIATTAQFAIASQTCGTLPATIAANGSCTININFTPSGTGTRNGTLTVTDDGPGGQQTASLTGNGVTSSGAGASLSPTSLTFALRLVNTTSPAKAVTLTNTGTATLNITSISTTGDFAIKSKTCGATLGAGLSCKISITFTPTGPGTRNGQLSVSDNAPGSPQSIPLTGQGTIVQLSPTSLNYGTLTVGTTSAPQSTTLTNKGNVVLTFTAAPVIKGRINDFAITANTCGSTGATVAPGQSCTFTMTFKPTATGTRTGTLNISDDGGGSPQKVHLSGVGQ
jgi:ASPM-SPD-2-Hydin domain-containing protein/HYDIN/CFA65/VesB family protein